MTVAIKRENGDLIWFDAILSFGRQLSGSVSKHPLETGAVLTDHTTIENEVISFSGLITDADFNLHRPLIDAATATQFDLINKQFVNNTPVASTPNGGALINNILINETSSLIRFLPESVGQFFDSKAPSVSLNPQTPTKVISAANVQARLIDIFNQRENFILLSFDSNKIIDSFDNCVMTSLNLQEDPDSGDAVYPIITIERVTYATSTSVKIKTRVSPSVEKKAADQQNKGKQQVDSKVDLDVDKKLDPDKASQMIKLGRL